MVQRLTGGVITGQLFMADTAICPQRNCFGFFVVFFSLTFFFFFFLLPCFPTSFLATFFQYRLHSDLISCKWRGLTQRWVAVFVESFQRRLFKCTVAGVQGQSYEAFCPCCFSPRQVEDWSQDTKKVTGWLEKSDISV